MPFDPSEVESAEPDPYTGKPTSVVYEDDFSVSDFLVRRGKFLFKGLPLGRRQNALADVTSRVEAEVSHAIQGTPIDPDQGLTFPAVGAYDSRGRLIDHDTAPQKFLDGIAYLCEVAAEGFFCPVGKGVTTIKESHPAEWLLISSAMPQALFS